MELLVPPNKHPALLASRLTLLSRAASSGVLLIALCLASPSQSAGARSEWFTTPGHAGALVLDLPAGWSFKTRSAGGRPTNIKIQTSGPEVTLTLMWNAGSIPEFNSPEQLRAAFKAAAGPFTEAGINSDFEIEELSGSEVTGVYSALVNPDLVDVAELAPDQYRILTPGILAVGEFQVFFSMMSKEKDSDNRLRALEMFREARFEADASSRVDTRVNVPVTVHEGPPTPSSDRDEQPSNGGPN